MKGEKSTAGAVRLGYIQRMASRDSILGLDYPRTLYTHAFAYSSWHGIWICSGVFALALLLACVGLFSPAPTGFTLTFETAAAVFGIVAMVLLFRIANRDSDLFHFTTVGIEAHGKMVPWANIVRVAANGSENAKTVQVFYTVEHSGGFKTHCLASVGEGVSRSEYERLIELLKQELCEPYPHLHLGGYFRVEF